MSNAGSAPGGTWATALREARRAAGLTHDQLADESDVSRWTIMRWEKGEPAKFPDQVTRVARVVGIIPEVAFRMLGWLPVDGEPAPPPAPPRFSDPVEQRIWEIPGLTERERLDLIAYRRARLQIGESPA